MLSQLTKYAIIFFVHPKVHRTLAQSLSRIFNYNIFILLY